MTEEQIQKVTATLREAVENERAYIEPVLRALGEGHQDLRRDVDEGADKLLKVTSALVQADGALAQRLDRIERELGIAERRGLLSRLFRKG